MQDQIYTIRDLGRFTLFSTVVLQPDWLGGPLTVICAIENSRSRAVA